MKMAPKPESMILTGFSDYIVEIKNRIAESVALTEYFSRLPLGRTRASSNEKVERAVTELTEEALTSLRLIDGFVRPGMRILEVGAGPGFAHAWLQKLAPRLELDVVAIEPSLAGHEPYFDMGKKLLELLGLDARRWHSLAASDVAVLGRRFDLIFSSNVLEHVDDVARVIQALAGCLKVNGIMRHNCPNYAFPFEPHFGIPLWPLKPQMAEWILPSLRHNPLWRGLNWVTAFSVSRAARTVDLKTIFDRDHVYRTLMRFEKDLRFREKHPVLFRIYQVLSKLGIPPLFKIIPARLMTPMQFTLGRFERS